MKNNLFKRKEKKSEKKGNPRKKQEDESGGKKDATNSGNCGKRKGYGKKSE